VLAPIKKLGLTPAFYDIDCEDLNPSVEMLSQLISQGDIGAVVFPSLYGLPADCIRAEALCRANDIIMIDDAAQSYGASLGGRAIGTFGDAGFIAFSPGKSTAAHGGGLYWVQGSSVAPRQRVALNHGLLLWAFQHARLDGADQNLLHGPAGILFGLLKRFPGWSDGASDIDANILGGVLRSLETGNFEFRNHWFARAENMSGGWKGLRLVRKARGKAHPHKIVLVADTLERADALSQALTSAGIKHGRGYPALSTSGVPNTTALAGHILELPIVADEGRMTGMLSSLQQL
jgi:dTDP-4-amino-4,6-dideoxygalactose transaminase